MLLLLGNDFADNTIVVTGVFILVELSVGVVDDAVVVADVGDGGAI